MKRWELQELKRLTNVFVKEYCSRVWRYIDAKNSLAEVYDEILLKKYGNWLKNWNSDVFIIRMVEKGGFVVIDFSGKSEVRCSEEIEISYLAKLTEDCFNGDYSLKELIVCLNELRFKPDLLEIKCTKDKVLELVIDGRKIIEEIKYDW